MDKFPLDYDCPVCKVPQGQPCLLDNALGIKNKHGVPGSNYHIARIDEKIRARVIADQKLKEYSENNQPESETQKDTEKAKENTRKLLKGLRTFHDFFEKHSFLYPEDVDVVKDLCLLLKETGVIKLN